VNGRFPGAANNMFPREGGGRMGLQRRKTPVSPSRIDGPEKLHMKGVGEEPPLPMRRAE